MRWGGVRDDLGVSRHGHLSSYDFPADWEPPPKWIAIPNYTVEFSLCLFRRQEALGVDVVPCAPVDGCLDVVSDRGRRFYHDSKMLTGRER